VVEVKPTSIWMLCGLAGAAGMLGWAYGAWVDGQGRLPVVPWLAVAVIWAVATFVGVWALVARRRLRPKPGGTRMAPLVAARTTALALAGSRTGAVVFGGYGGLALRLVQEMGVSAGRERLLAAALASVGGLALGLLSLWLEHICRLPEDKDPPALGLGQPGSGPGGRIPEARA